MAKTQKCHHLHVEFRNAQQFLNSATFIAEEYVFLHNIHELQYSINEINNLVLIWIQTRDDGI